ncbi:hypothetical protein [Alkalitalea saponilacus]|uniref:ABC-2 type transport system permease protein n=1 Tax=Alkalitalea saponilacus TaxID=889453 RepID=A0A1T5EI13_9BACT|nr:hypothetical protein [Alkalitalea saponilacus]ASB48978.1 hypothetical protein CDL62_07430 [Alkalitalea saponilacus]SKB83445.1 hypothetical protein SAMN03080601_01347 [Alkalitalea saponilacus]
MNDIFNLKRFISYAKYQTLVNLRVKMLLLSSLIIGITGYLFIVISYFTNGNWFGTHWWAFTYLLFAIFLIFYTGNSFPGLRSKEKATDFLLIPASTLEKYIYEFFERVVFPFIAIPVLLFTICNAVVYSLGGILEMNHRYVDISFFSLSYLQDLDWSMVAGLVFMFLFLFAGGTLFKRFPAIKSIVSMAVIMSLVMYVLFKVASSAKISLGFLVIETRVVNELDNQVTTSYDFSVWFFLALVIILISGSYMLLKRKELK